MNSESWRELINQLRGVEYQVGLLAETSPIHRVAFDAGLTTAEVIATETRFGFRFPPDLREFLQTALPRGDRFPDWRSGDERVMREWLDRPRRGILFDVEHGFWLEEWGPHPRTLAEATEVIDGLMREAPKLVPVYGHRMMPDEPHEAGNPVFSVHQTDIIHYGFDLADYLRCEFDLGGREPWPERVRDVRFWDLNRFQDVRWSNGPCVFDNRDGQLP